MPFTRSGKHYMLRAKRRCQKCGDITEQQAFKCTYHCPPVPKVPPVYIKTLEWLCLQCDNVETEQKEIPEPTDKSMLLNRLIRIPSDYDTLAVTITSLPNELVFRVRLPDYDMGEIRAIQAKARETGFISVGELMNLQKAGYRRPQEVPPKPQPKERSVLRERARQRAFQGMS